MAIGITTQYVTTNITGATLIDNGFLTGPCPNKIYPTTSNAILNPNSLKFFPEKIEFCIFPQKRSYKLDKAVQTVNIKIAK